MSEAQSTWFKTAEQQQAEREEAELARRFTYKTDIWQRCNEAEADILDAALEQAPAKDRRMWADSITIEHSSEYYSLLKQQMVAQFGAARTSEILSPSNIED